MIPDGNGGILANWIVDNTNPLVAPQPYQAADVVGGTIVASYAMPNAPATLTRGPSGLPVGPAMVVGENGTAFAAYGPNVTSFASGSGSANWNYQPAAGVNSVLAAEGGGILVIDGVLGQVPIDLTGSAGTTIA